MGRKKIVIERITDERNRQVRNEGGRERRKEEGEEGEEGEGKRKEKKPFVD